MAVLDVIAATAAEALRAGLPAPAPATVPDWWSLKPHRKRPAVRGSERPADIAGGTIQHERIP